MDPWGQRSTSNVVLFCCTGAHIAYFYITKCTSTTDFYSSGKRTTYRSLVVKQFAQGQSQSQGQGQGQKAFISFFTVHQESFLKRNNFKDKCKRQTKGRGQDKVKVKVKVNVKVKVIFPLNF